MSQKPVETMIVLTTGKQDRGTRATLAFSWGCAALAMGQSVAIYLTMDGTVWGMQGASRGVVVHGFEPLENYIDQFLALGGEILICAPCSEYYCCLDGLLPTTAIRENAKLVGLATIVQRTASTTRIISL